MKTDDALNQLSREAADKITKVLADYRQYGPEVTFYALVNALVLVMANDFDNVKHMAKIIGGLDWIYTAGQWRKLIDTGYQPVLSRDLRNYQ
jgi:hypothetical protein